MDVIRKPNIILPGNISNKISEWVDPLMLTDHQVQQVMEILRKEMFLGMDRNAEARKQTPLQMECTHIRSLLNGEEEGEFLALDLGGTNFRVLKCSMKNGRSDCISRNYNVPKPKLTGPSIGVFDHLAESIYLFLKEENMLDRQHIPLGFTFSFPMVQEGLKKGILVTWTKSFACPDGVGDDAVKMLEDAIARRGDISVDVVAVLNDTTGTLMAGSYLDKKCFIGMILGTGSNAAYLEDLEKIDKWEGDLEDPKEMVVDIEWGAFGDNGSLDCLKMQYDWQIDKYSHHVGSFTFEKLFAGHYVGDLVRLVLLKLSEEGVLNTDTHQVPLHSVECSRLAEWGSVTASMVSDVEKDNDSDVTHTKAFLQEIGHGEMKSDTLTVNVVRYVCSAVSIRCAQLIAASVATLLLHMKRPEVTVAIDGSLYRYHPKLHDMMTDWIRHLAPSIKCQLILAENGSGLGAAYVAAVVKRLEKETHHQTHRYY